MNSGKIKNICIVILSIILFVYLVLFVNSLMHNEKVGFFNARFYIMPEDSKELQLNEGDLVVARTIKPEKLKENDKVLYRKDDLLYVKQIASVSSLDGRVNLVVKQSSEQANENVDDAKIIGKVIGKVSRIGNVALFVQSPLGTFNVIILIVCIVIIIKKIFRKTENDANV